MSRSVCFYWQTGQIWTSRWGEDRPEDRWSVSHLLHSVQHRGDVHETAELDPRRAVPTLYQVDQVEHAHERDGNVDVAFVARRHLPVSFDGVQRQVDHHLSDREEVWLQGSPLTDAHTRPLQFRESRYFHKLKVTLYNA